MGVMSTVQRGPREAWPEAARSAAPPSVVSVLVSRFPYETRVQLLIPDPHQTRFASCPSIDPGASRGGGRSPRLYATGVQTASAGAGRESGRKKNVKEP